MNTPVYLETSSTCPTFSPQNKSTVNVATGNSHNLGSSLRPHACVRGVSRCPCIGGGEVCCVVHAPFGSWPRHRRRHQEGCTPQAQPVQPARMGTASSIAVDGGQALSIGEQRRVLDSGVHECGWGATKGERCACKAFICLHAE
jgi:hypothetical protein